MSGYVLFRVVRGLWRHDHETWGNQGCMAPGGDKDTTNRCPQGTDPLERITTMGLLQNIGRSKDEFIHQFTSQSAPLETYDCLWSRTHRPAPTLERSAAIATRRHNDQFQWATFSRSTEWWEAWTFFSSLWSVLFRCPCDTYNQPYMGAMLSIH